MSKQDVEREYNSFDVQEKESGKLLYEAFDKFSKQYIVVSIGTWDELDVKFKITWTRTAKAVKYAL